MIRSERGECPGSNFNPPAQFLVSISPPPSPVIPFHSLLFPFSPSPASNCFTHTYPHTNRSHDYRLSFIFLVTNSILHLSFFFFFFPLFQLYSYSLLPGFIFSTRVIEMIKHHFLQHHRIGCFQILSRPLAFTTPFFFMIIIKLQCVTVAHFALCCLI